MAYGSIIKSLNIFENRPVFSKWDTFQSLPPPPWVENVGYLSIILLMVGHTPLFNPSLGYIEKLLLCDFRGTDQLYRQTLLVHNMDTRV